ncbi:regulatory protein RecX [bacterium]|nr:regulatory protein RecX [bacterium]
MPVIVSVKVKSKRTSRLLLSFDDEREPLEVAGEVFALSRMAKGDGVNEEQLAKLLRDDLRFRCKQKAWGLLDRRMRSRKEMRTALFQRKFPADIVNEVIADLAEKGFLDDAAFARVFVEQRDARGQSGPRLVRQELAARGVAPEIAEKGIVNLGQSETQEAKARALLLKWNRRSKPEDPRKRRQAAAAYLMRRGFDSDIVWELVREIITGLDE